MLKNIDGISPETMVLLWSMKERHNPKSRFRFYFDALPNEFRTGDILNLIILLGKCNSSSFFPGLSFGIEALVSIDGTALFEELVQAKEVSLQLIRL